MYTYHEVKGYILNFALIFLIILMLLPEHTSDFIFRQLLAVQ